MLKWQHLGHTGLSQMLCYNYFLLVLSCVLHDCRRLWSPERLGFVVDLAFLLGPGSLGMIVCIHTKLEIVHFHVYLGSLFNCAYYSFQDHQPSGGPAHSELGPPTWVINQENSLQVNLVGANLVRASLVGPVWWEPIWWGPIIWWGGNMVGTSHLVGASLVGANHLVGAKLVEAFYLLRLPLPIWLQLCQDSIKLASIST